VRINGKVPQIGYIRGPVCEHGYKYPFVIATVQSLAQKAYPEELYSAFRTVIFDECHHLPADTFLTVAYKFRARYLIGVTATLRRKDGTEKVFTYALGDVLYTMIRKEVQGRVFFVPVPFLIEKSRICAAGMTSLAKMGTTFATLEYRNELILKHILKAYQEGRKNLVLASTREHLSILFAALPAVIQKRTGFYVGGRKEEALTKAADKQILLGTYGMAYEGMDVPDVDMLTLATPVKDVEQPVGRILRHHALKMHPVIVDFVDQHRTLIRWARERTMYYKREGFQLLTPIPV
jgi:superfamily II DNA or RNA helicase